MVAFPHNNSQNTTMVSTTFVEDAFVLSTNNFNLTGEPSYTQTVYNPIYNFSATAETLTSYATSKRFGLKSSRDLNDDEYSRATVETSVQTLTFDSAFDGEISYIEYIETNTCRPFVTALLPDEPALRTQYLSDVWSRVDEFTVRVETYADSLTTKYEMPAVYVTHVPCTSKIVYFQDSGNTVDTIGQDYRFFYKNASISRSDALSNIYKSYSIKVPNTLKSSDNSTLYNARTDGLTGFADVLIYPYASTTDTNVNFGAFADLLCRIYEIQTLDSNDTIQMKTKVGLSTTTMTAYFYLDREQAGGSQGNPLYQENTIDNYQGFWINPNDEVFPVAHSMGVNSMRFFGNDYFLDHLNEPIVTVSAKDSPYEYTHFVNNEFEFGTAGDRGNKGFTLGSGQGLTLNRMCVVSGSDRIDTRSENGVGEVARVEQDFCKEFFTNGHNSAYDFNYIGDQILLDQARSIHTLYPYFENDWMMGLNQTTNSFETYYNGAYHTVTGTIYPSPMVPRNSYTKTYWSANL